MVMGTDEFNKNIKEINCLHLDVEDYSHEIVYDHPENITINGGVFYVHLVRFKKNNKKYRVFVAPIIKKVVVKSFPFEHIEYKYDNEKMEKNLKWLIKREHL